MLTFINVEDKAILTIVTILEIHHYSKDILNPKQGIVDSSKNQVIFNAIPSKTKALMLVIVTHFWKVESLHHPKPYTQTKCQ